MSKLTRNDLMSLEQYAQERPAFREKVMQHKKNRQVLIGDNATLYFEDRLTMQYQIQEMLRVERIFEAEGIQEELDVYNPLIPDGSNWKATFMLEYEDEHERRKALARLVGIEMAVWIQVQGHAKVYPISNEDLDRTTPDKTASVHFMRFELTPEMVQSAKQGAAFSAGIDHPEYKIERSVPDAVREALCGDLT